MCCKSVFAIIKRMLEKVPLFFKWRIVLLPPPPTPTTVITGACPISSFGISRKSTSLLFIFSPLIV